jgi:hypothetical protein
VQKAAFRTTRRNHGPPILAHALLAAVVHTRSDWVGVGHAISEMDCLRNAHASPQIRMLLTDFAERKNLKRAYVHLEE